MTMKRIKNLFGIFAFSLLVLSLPAVASAQWGGGNGNRNGGYGGYGNGGYNNSQLRDTIRRLRNDSRDFARFVDRDLDNSRYNGSNREDNLNQLAKDFKDAASRLESRFGNGRNLNDSAREAQNVLNLANQVDRAMRRSRLSSNVQNYWNNIENQLSQISYAYGYRNNNNNNRGRGNNGNNGGWRNFPFPF
jgi:hypothetical protein